MMECPVCHRSEVRAELCPRCGTDLSSLKKVREFHLRLMEEGRAFLRRRQFRKGLKSFQEAYRLMRTDQARKGVIVALFCLYIESSDSSICSVGIADFGRVINFEGNHKKILGI
ncbi:MAG: hypothetical protein U9N73_00305 [Candidatus Auribacterota bacterium]|nr:hypothetical protein [Candidatus Auribacterota bacterium]